MPCKINKIKHKIDKHNMIRRINSCMPLINLQLRNRFKQILCDCDLWHALLLPSPSSMLLLLLLTINRTIIKIPIYYRQCSKLWCGNNRFWAVGNTKIYEANFSIMQSCRFSLLDLLITLQSVCLLDVNYMKFPKFAHIRLNSNLICKCFFN